MSCVTGMYVCAFMFTSVCLDVCILQHQLYIKAYKVLTSTKPIETVDDEIAYSKLVRQLLDNHGVRLTVVLCYTLHAASSSVTTRSRNALWHIM